MQYASYPRLAQEGLLQKNVNNEKKISMDVKEGYGSGENDYAPSDDRGLVSVGDSGWRHIKDGSTAVGRASKCRSSERQRGV